MNSDDTLSFTSSGSNDLVEAIYVDGVLLTEDCYVLGVSNEITLSSELLDNITTGKHTLIVSYSDDRIASVDFVVSEKNINPKTGSFLSIKFISTLLVLFLVIIVFKNKFRKLHKI